MRFLSGIKRGSEPTVSALSCASSMQTVLLLGPDLKAVSGVSTHLNQLLRSSVGRDFRLLHFQVGSEGRSESLLEKLWRSIWSPCQLMAIFRKHKPTIVHINTSMERKAFWRDLMYLLVSRLSGRKVVYQVHGGQLPCEFTAGNPILRELLRAVLRMPNVIVLLAEAERQAYYAFSPDLRLQLVTNAIDVDVLGAPKRSIRSDSVLNLVYVGRLAEVKGVFEALEATALLRDEGISVNLAIAGSGPAERQLRLRIAELGIEDRVTLKGPLFGAEKNELWLNSDAFLFPTSHHEGLPYALLESMAAGTVPVTCPVGAIPDVIEHQKHGLFVPPKDARALAAAIKWLHEHRDELSRLGEAARQRVLQNYTVTRMANDFRQIYRQL